MSTKKYPKPLIIFHWLTVVLVISQIVIGKNLEKLDYTPENFNAYRLHAFLGMFLLLITLARMFYKRKHINEIPALRYYGPTHKILVNGVHMLMYILLIVIPLVGFYTIYQTGGLAYDLGGPFPSVEPDKTLTELHEKLVLLLVTLIAAHVGGVLMYKLKTGENLLKRMCLLA